MNINTGLAVCVLCHHTRDERYSKQMQLVGYTVCSDGKQSRIAKDNLIVIVGCRVSVKKRSHISLHQSPDFWNPFKEIIADFLRHIDKLVMRQAPVFRILRQGKHHLLAQIVHDILQKNSNLAVQVVISEARALEIARIHYLNKL